MSKEKTYRYECEIRLKLGASSNTKYKRNGRKNEIEEIRADIFEAFKEKVMRGVYRSKKEEHIISGMIFGYTELNSTLLVILKKQTYNRQMWTLWWNQEEHVFLHCSQYQQGRLSLTDALHRNKTILNIKDILMEGFRRFSVQDYI